MTIDHTGVDVPRHHSLRRQWTLGLLIACGGAALWPFVMIGLIGLVVFMIGGIALVAAQVRLGLLAATTGEEQGGLGRRLVVLLVGVAGVVTVLVAMFLSPFTFVTEAGRLGPFHPTVRLSVVFGGGIGPGSLALPLVWLGGSTLIGLASSGLRWPLRASVLGHVAWALLAGPLAAAGFWVVSRVWPFSA